MLSVVQVDQVDQVVQRVELPLLLRAQQQPHAPAVVDGARRLTYGELARAAGDVAGELVRAGVRSGDRVAIFLDKCPDAVVALYAIWIADAIAVPIHDALHAPQVRHILAHSGAGVVITRDNVRARVDADVFAGVRAVAIDLDRARTAAWVPSVRGTGELAAILYTSGSTGRPKGIAITHANLRAGARIVSRYLELNGDDRILSVLPFSFDYGLNQLLTAVRVGATLVLARSPLPADVCRALVSHDISVLAGVPPFWIQLMQRASPFSVMRFPALRVVTNSGGALPVEIVHKLRAHLPRARLFLMYGLSEAFRSTYLPPSELDARPTSMGKAIPECTIHVVTEDGRDAAPGEIGELVHTGPTVALGYWRDPEATAQRFRAHPFDPASPQRAVYSGDLVKRDADGFLYFVGRRDQLIKSHGFRISPEEVEELVHQSGLVSEVVAHGVPDEVAGQAVVLHIVPRATPSITTRAPPSEGPSGDHTQALLAYCREQMPRYMVPKRVVVHEQLPRTSSGKVDRARVGAA